MTNFNKSGTVFSEMMDEIFNSSFNDLVGKRHTKTSPSLNIVEQDDKYIIKLAAPGKSKESFDLRVKDMKLTIKAGGSTPEESKSADHDPITVRKEFDFTSFERKVTLSDDIDLSNINATYTDGVLYIDLLKKETYKKDDIRSISIN